MNTTKRKTHRRITKRELTSQQKLLWGRQAGGLLAHAESIWEQAQNYDTAVRDSISDGLAYIVNAAYDCQANAMEFTDTEAWLLFIESSTAAWFRKRGFVEWFCGAAASLFRTTPPRALVVEVKSRSNPKRRRRQTAA